MHIMVPLSAIAFNVINGSLMGSWLAGRTPWTALPQPATESVAHAAVDNALGTTAGHAAAPLISWALGQKLFSTTAAEAKAIPAPGLISNAVWKSPLWYLGLAGWVIGFAGNVYHDEILMDIRRPDKQAQQADQDTTSVGKGNSARKYSIPRGGLFEYISFPNYVCECKFRRFRSELTAETFADSLLFFCSLSRVRMVFVRIRRALLVAHFHASQRKGRIRNGPLYTAFPLPLCARLRHGTQGCQRSHLVQKDVW